MIARKEGLVNIINILKTNLSHISKSKNYKWSNNRLEKEYTSIVYGKKYKESKIRTIEVRINKG